MVGWPEILANHVPVRDFLPGVMEGRVSEEAEAHGVSA